ncbi:MAG: TolC family protein, partial [Rikenellaceae bacterium]
QSKLAQSNTELQLRQQLEQEYNTVMTGYQKYLTSNERAEAYRQSAAAYRQQYEHGQITVVEMLQQETNYLSALNDYIQNKYTYLLNRKLVDVYMGVQITL